MQTQITINGKQYREVRCPVCRKLICYEQILAGEIAIVCPRCDHPSTIEFKFLDVPSNKTKLNKYIIENMKGGEV